MNQDVRKLEQYFAGRDFLNVKIRAERNPRDGMVNVRFVVDEGPKITFVFEGAKMTDDFSKISARSGSEALR